jgi:hypothetical protein
MLLIVNGYGASVEYMDSFLKHLDSQEPHLVLSLLHGVSLEEECARVNAIIERHRPTTIMGFSTGCVVISACLLTDRDTDTDTYRRIIFVNPPDISSRKGLCAGLRYLTDPKTTRALTFLGYLWTGLQWVMGPFAMARLYHRVHGARVNEPPAKEIARIVTARSLRDMVVTLKTCLLDPGMQPMIEFVKRGNCRVDVFVGDRDPYQHVARALFEVGPLVRLHRIADADHHMLYHLPRLCADRVRGLLL